MGKRPGVQSQKRQNVHEATLQNWCCSLISVL